MKRGLPIWLLAFLCLSVQGDDLKVLLTYGGHKFKKKTFFEVFDNLPGIRYTPMPLPESLNKLTPQLAKEYDVIVMYDMMKSPSSKAQRRMFAKLLGSGIGVVSLHHNIAAWRDWDEFVFVVGGKYIFTPEIINGREYRKTKTHPGRMMRIRVADPDHPITQGIKPFEICDETFGGYYVFPRVHLLLTTNHPENNKEIAWTTRYENSPVCYIQLGHDSRAWKNPVYPKLLANAIHWAAEKSRKAKKRKRKSNR